MRLTPEQDELTSKLDTLKTQFRVVNPSAYSLLTWNLPGDINMEIDCRLLDSKFSVFRLYTWREPTLSLGRLQRPDRYSELLERAKQAGVKVVTRPTGGRAVLHYKELTYSFAGYRSGLNVKDIHLIFNALFKEALSDLELSLTLEPDSFSEFSDQLRKANCFLIRSIYELTYNGKKVMGSAIRLKADRFLIHGSLLLERDELWAKVFGELGDEFISLKEIDDSISLEVVVERVLNTIERFFRLRFEEVSLEKLIRDRELLRRIQGR